MESKDPFIRMLEAEERKNQQADGRSSTSLDIQEYRNTRIQTSRNTGDQQRLKATYSLTREQLKTVDQIKFHLALHNDLDIEKSEIIGLGITLVGYLFQHTEAQQAKDLELFKRSCIEVVERAAHAHQ
ncbi:MAG: hypothetical protein HY709_08920 [Candidatus Latescibacteria bacterium]|nr:hypothetical protein [Candidatus Latescibacterota bacterium]